MKNLGVYLKSGPADGATFHGRPWFEGHLKPPVLRLDGKEDLLTYPRYTKTVYYRNALLKFSGIVVSLITLQYACDTIIRTQLHE